MLCFCEDEEEEEDAMGELYVVGLDSPIVTSHGTSESVSLTSQITPQFHISFSLVFELRCGLTNSAQLRLVLFCKRFLKNPKNVTSLRTPTRQKTTK